MPYPLGLSSQGHNTELDPVSMAYTLADTTALATYAGAVTTVLTPDARKWNKKASTDPVANNRLASITTGQQWVNSIKDCANILDYAGIDPKGVNDNTAIIQKAINECCKAVNPGVSGKASPYRDITTRLYFPDGVYVVTDEIVINGALFLDLAPGVSYAGARIIQTVNGKHLFHLGKDTDGSSNCFYLRGGCLRAGASSLTVGTSLVYGGEGTNDGGNNSFYADRTWFGTPEDCAIYLKRGDDFQAVGCTFDAAAYHSIRLGSGTNYVSNASILGNTFYDIRAGAIDLVNVKGAVITNNRVYGTTSNQSAYFVNASTNAVSNKSILITNNVLNKVNALAILNSTSVNVRISNNDHTECVGPAIIIGGGGTPSKLRITHNNIEGDFSGTTNVGGSTTAPNAPIFAYGTGLQNCRIQANDLTHTGAGTATTPLLLTDSRTSYNKIGSNTASGFADSGQVANPLLNTFAFLSTLSTIGPAALVGGQRIVGQRVVTGVKPGDLITLSDTSGSWTGNNGVSFQAFCGQPDIVHVIIENLNTSMVTIPGMNFLATITRP